MSGRGELTISAVPLMEESISKAAGASFLVNMFLRRSSEP